MEKARQAVSNFVSLDGKHKTTVDEDVRQAVTDEHILPHQHENITTAIDREIHQDHHHTTVQPINVKETLPEQHTHNVVAVEHKTFEHGDEKELQAALDRDAAQYQDTSVTHATTHSTSEAPVVAGERVHHHVHEHIQPVIQKETIAPQVIHTTVPIHETHHAQAVHHGTTTLPVKTLEEFTKEKGGVQGRGLTKLTEYEGCPEHFSKDLRSEQMTRENQSSNRTGVVAGQTLNDGSSKLTEDGARSSDERLGSRTSSSSGNSSYTMNNSTAESTSAGLRTSNSLNKTEPRFGSDIKSSGTHDTTGSTGTRATKISLKDKLNPFKDADGDGKKGIMT